MEQRFHDDPVFREEAILQYLERRMPEDQVEALESHYLSCVACFEEMRATELLVQALGAPVLQRRRIDDVTVLHFAQGTQLLAASLELNELAQAVRTPNESKDLIDLS